MRSKQFTYLLAGLIAAMVAGCAQGDRKKPVVICNAQGCVQRSADHAEPPPSPDAAEQEAERRLAALRQAAMKDPRAAYDLGLRFFRGDGVRQDSHQSLLWMREAATRGDLDAQKALGRLYLTGLEEMGADPREAEKWLTITAGRGDAEAETLLTEATTAKRSEQAWHRWRSHWRPIFYRYWSHDYRYRSYWQAGYWHYY